MPDRGSTQLFEKNGGNNSARSWLADYAGGRSPHFGCNAGQWDPAQQREQIDRVIGLLTTGSPSSSDNRRI
jgi:hypothetical protein